MSSTGTSRTSPEVAIPAIPVAGLASTGTSNRVQSTAPVSKISGTQGVVVRALHKSASMFLYKFFEQVAFDSRIDYFSSNHQQPNEAALTSSTQKSFCVCPIRDFNPRRFNEFPWIEKQTQIFHVRDPRDLIVSQYFSFGWIHEDGNFSRAEKLRRAKVCAMTIDEYVVDQKASNIESRYAPLLQWLENSDDSTQKILVKYETMVTNFSSWVRSVIRPFPFRRPGVAAMRYAWRYRNEFKTKGETMAHKRRITPGDHKEKLKPETIKKLNERYELILKKLGYEM